ncbi:hypothetical protein EC180050_1389 [Escherichia coli 180050]|nr:hypothetical protein EC180050_1389 [Escherichia coli 180050]
MFCGVNSRWANIVSSKKMVEEGEIIRNHIFNRYLLEVSTT